MQSQRKSRYLICVEGFSLIELLVVIAIIAVLSAVLFPVVTGAKEKGRQTTCLNNLKQLGTGMQMYADDANGQFPVARVSIGGARNPRGNWAGVYDVYDVCEPTLGQIYRYVRSAKVYLCPNDRGIKAPRVANPQAQPYPLSYSMNNISDYRISSTLASSSKVGLLVHESRETIDDGDFYWFGWVDGGVGDNQPSNTHNGGTCVLYCDLHAQWKTYEAVLEELRDGLWDPLNITRQ